MTPTLTSSLLLLLLAALTALALGALGLRRAASAASALLIALASAAGLYAALIVLLGGERWAWVAPWGFAGASFRLGIDPLSALFLLPIFTIGPLAALYAHGYLAPGARRIGPHLAAFAGLLASMALVVSARDTVLLAFAWELMTLLTFLLVSFEDQEREVRRAAFLYVTISHVAATLVLAFLLVVADRSGTTDLSLIADGSSGEGGWGRALLLLLALVGFGTKAGIVPLHVWLPRAHPAAPSHVSALMSGVVVKTAIYALLRAASLLGTSPAWWGYVLLGLGALTGVGGILFALAQRDLKRLLAYSTIENVGVILLGLGIGILGAAHHQPLVALFGTAGALMHVLHHALMKGLLFAAAGSLVHATHLRSLDSLGGLLRRMPLSGGSFLVGALGVAAMPGLCGFASELLIYLALGRGVLALPEPARVASLVGLLALATIGGLAAATLTKAAGLALLGAPRSPAAEHAREAAPAMTAPLLLMAGGVVALGVVPGITARLALPAAAVLLGGAGPGVADAGRQALELMSRLGEGVLLVFSLAGAGALARAWLLRARAVSAGPTWGCGYGATSPRMQYSATSYSAPLADLARAAVRPAVDYVPPEGCFPQPARRHSELVDPAERHLFEAGAAWARARLLSLRWLQRGRLQLYLLYILLTVVALLAWDAAWDLLQGGVR